MKLPGKCPPYMLLRRFGVFGITTMFRLVTQERYQALVGLVFSKDGDYPELSD